MGFDLWSFAFQTINFVVLLFVLTKLVYRPLRRSIDKRNAEIKDREEAAAALGAESDEKMRQVEQSALRFSEEREAILGEAREQAVAIRARLVAQAEEEATAARARSKHLVEIEREALLDRARELAVDKSVALASVLVAGLSHDAIDEALLKMLLDEVKTKLAAPDAAGARRAGTSAAQEVEVTFARPPRPEATARLRTTISEAIGATVDITRVDEDPSLVGGLIVRMRHQVWDASISGQLTAFRDRVRRELDKESTGG